MVENDRLGRSCLVRLLFVAIATGNGYMPTRQDKLRLFVTDQRKRGRIVSLQRVATFTGVKIWSRRELPIVLIFVAIGAVLKFNLEERVFALRDMTFAAIDGEMFPFERVSRGCVIFRCKRRRFEAIHGMAGGALRTAWPFGKLAVMRIGLVTIHAGGERDRLFKISTCVAERAIHGRVFSLERILGFRVVEVPIHGCQRNFLPAFGAVA